MGKMFCYASNRKPPRGPTEAEASASADLERCHGRAGSRLGAGPALITGALPSLHVGMKRKHGAPWDRDGRPD